MKGSTWPVAAVALSLLLTAVAVQAKQAAKRDKDRSSYRIVTIQPYELLVRTTGGAVCDLTTASECTITMRTIPFGGRNYCLAEAPNIKVRTDTGGGSHLKAIVWKLSPATVDGKPVAFHADSGIVVVDDPNTQIDKKDHGYGNGGGGSNPPTDQYYIKTKRDKVDAKASYLPVILWNPGPDAELCAASDPKIVNAP